MRMRNPVQVQDDEKDKGEDKEEEDKREDSVGCSNRVGRTGLLNR